MSCVVYSVPLQQTDMLSTAHSGSCCWCWYYVCVFLPSEILCMCLKTQKTSSFSGELLPLFFLCFSFRPVRFCAVGFVVLCCVVACEFVTRSHRLQKDETLWFRFLFETFSPHFLCFIFFVSYKDIHCSLVVLLNTKNSKQGIFFWKKPLMLTTAALIEPKIQ